MTNMNIGKAGQYSKGNSIIGDGNINQQVEKNRRANIELDSFIFPDTRALFTLDLASYMDLSYEEVTIHGFEIYIVEQWISERKISSIITSYTGNTQDSVSAIRVLLPKNPSIWPGKFKQYYDELLTFAKPKLITHGQLFITNTSTFPSLLNIFHIECGDLRTVWQDFKINFDLKMLHCAGRSALLLSAPSMAAQEKFSQLFKIPIIKDQANEPNILHRHLLGHSTSGNPGTSHPNSSGNNNSNLTSKQQQSSTNYYDKKCDVDSNDHPTNLQKQQPAGEITNEFSPVVEMIELIQISLRYFNRYNKDIDGLLCNYTKRAIDSWWEDYGKLYFGQDKPLNEATMGPTTTAALISLVLSAYFKLMLEDCLSAKDPFDQSEYFTGIYNFQKKYNLIRPGKKIYMDHLTLEKLFEVTAKYSNNDFLRFKKVVTCRVQDMVGKGNPIHLANTILTTDLDTLVTNFHGGSLGLLWKGKGRSRRVLGLDQQKDFRRFKFQKGNPELQLKNQQNLIKTGVFKRAFGQSYDAIGRELNKDFNIDAFIENRTWENQDETNIEMSPSVMSISSMFCNYDKPKVSNNKTFCKSYHNEFHRRNSLPLINDGTCVMVDMDEENENSKKTVLYRSNSQSEICDVLEKWKLPFDPSVIKLARDLRRTEVIFANKPTFDKNQGIVFPVITPDTDRTASNSTEDNIPDDKEDELDPEDKKKYDDHNEDLRINYEKYNLKSNDFETRSRVIEGKQQLLLNEMHEINSLSSKLKYDLRILDLRVRDVEDSISQFDRKLRDARNSLMINDQDASFAIGCLSDKAEYDKCIKNMLLSQNTCYRGIWLKMFNRTFFENLKEDISGWVNYLFQNFTTQDVSCEYRAAAVTPNSKADIRR